MEGAGFVSKALHFEFVRSKHLENAGATHEGSFAPSHRGSGFVPIGMPLPE